MKAPIVSKILWRLSYVAIIVVIILLNIGEIMKKEIEVWVSKHFMASENRDCTVSGTIRNYKNSDGMTPFKATLIIEVPEKEITITESEYRESVNPFFPYPASKKIDEAVQELFGDSDE